MRAEQFIKGHGLERAKECLPSYEKHYCGLEQLFVEDLKRLVESVYKVNSFGGLKDAKAVVKMGKHYKYLKAHISNYESIYGDGNE